MRCGLRAMLAAGLILLSSLGLAHGQVLSDDDFTFTVSAGNGRLARILFQIPFRAAVANDTNFHIHIDPITVEEVTCNNLKDEVHLRKRPGKTKYQNIILKRGFTSSSTFFEDWFHEAASCLASPDCSSWGAKSAFKSITMTSSPSKEDAKTGPSRRMFQFSECLVTGWRVFSQCVDGACEQVEEVVIRIGRIDMVMPLAAGPSPLVSADTGAVSLPAGSGARFVRVNATGQMESAVVPLARYLNPGQTIVPARMAPRCEPSGGHGIDNDCDGFVVPDAPDCVEGDPDALFACESTIAMARLADACGLVVTRTKGDGVRFNDMPGADVSAQYNPKEIGLDKIVSAQYNPKEIGLDKSGRGAVEASLQAADPFARAMTFSATYAVAIGIQGAQDPRLLSTVAGSYSIGVTLGSTLNFAAPGSSSSSDKLVCPNNCTGNHGFGRCAINTATRCTTRCNEGRNDEDCDGLSDEVATVFGNGKLVTHVHGDPHVDQSGKTVSCDDVETLLRANGGLRISQGWPWRGALHRTLMAPPDVSFALSQSNPELFMEKSQLTNNNEGFFWAAGYSADNNLVPKRGYIAQGALLLEPQVAFDSGASSEGGWPAGRAIYMTHRRGARRSARQDVAAAVAAGWSDDEVLVVSFLEREGDPFTCRTVSTDNLSADEAFEQGRIVGMEVARPGCTGPAEDCIEYFDSVFLRQYDFPSFSGSGVSSEKVWLGGGNQCRLQVCKIGRCSPRC